MERKCVFNSLPMRLLSLHGKDVSRSFLSRAQVPPQPLLPASVDSRFQALIDAPRKSLAREHARSHSGQVRRQERLAGMSTAGLASTPHTLSDGAGNGAE